jgi:hypothetical protein
MKGYKMTTAISPYQIGTKIGKEISWSFPDDPFHEYDGFELIRKENGKFQLFAQTYDDSIGDWTDKRIPLSEFKNRFGNIELVS